MSLNKNEIEALIEHAVDDIVSEVFENKFSKIFKTNSLFSYGSDFDLRRRVNGAINTGDSKQTAISLKNLLLERKFKFGRSSAKLINLSFSFFSINAIVLLM